MCHLSLTSRYSLSLFSICDCLTEGLLGDYSSVCPHEAAEETS